MAKKIITDEFRKISQIYVKKFTNETGILVYCKQKEADDDDNDDERESDRTDASTLLQL